MAAPDLAEILFGVHPSAGVSRVSPADLLADAAERREAARCQVARDRNGFAPPSAETVMALREAEIDLARARAYAARDAADAALRAANVTLGGHAAGLAALPVLDQPGAVRAWLSALDAAVVAVRLGDPERACAFGVADGALGELRERLYDVLELALAGSR